MFICYNGRKPCQRRETGPANLSVNAPVQNIKFLPGLQRLGATIELESACGPSSQHIELRTARGRTKEVKKKDKEGSAVKVGLGKVEESWGGRGLP